MSRRRYLNVILSRRSGVFETLREMPLKDWLALAASKF